VAKRSAAQAQAEPSTTPATSPDLNSVEGAVERTVDLDRIIHERLRLGIVSALVVNESLGFSELRDLLKTTDGNLSVHARKLEEAGYVSCRKSFIGRTPHTEFKITAPGRRALQRYLDHMEALISATRR
jgi:DNA-binding MarR family transcriptional regulator